MNSLSIHCGAHWPRIDSNHLSDDLNPRRLSLLNGVWPLSGCSWDEAWWVRGAMGPVRRSTWQVWLLANRDENPALHCNTYFFSTNEKSWSENCFTFSKCKDIGRVFRAQEKKKIVNRREKARKNAFNAKVIEIRSTKTKIQPESK